MTYTVVSPLVIATAENGSQHHLYQGSPVPAFIGKDELKRLADDGHIERQDAEESGDSSDEAPKGNASRDEWAAYAKDKKDAPDEDTRPVSEGGLSQTALREKYGN